MAAADPVSLELTSAQLGIWYAQQVAADDTVLNIAECMKIDGGVVDVLVRAVRHVLSATDAFRVRFRVEDGEPRQFLADTADIAVQVVDVAGDADPRAAAEAWMRAEATRPVDLVAGP